MIRIDFLAVLFAIAVAAAAQVQPGHAVVAWKQGGTAPGGLVLVDPAGASTSMPGLDPATVGTGQYDGATAVLVTDDGTVFAGLGVDNRTGTTPVNLDLRQITWNGSTAVDLAFVTLQPVPPGQIWRVSDLKERADGSLLVAATQVVFGPNPVGTPAVFVVGRTGPTVTSVPTTGMAGGILRAIADFGDRFAVAVEQSFFSRNFVLQSLAFDGLSAPFTIRTLVGVGSFGGFDRDLGAELVFGASFGAGGSTVHRIAHAPGATSTPVPGSPPSIRCGGVGPASGVLSSFDSAGALSRTDSVLGGTQPWAASVVGDPIAIAVRDNPSGYGLVPPQVALPMLGSQGNVPDLGNARFALRLGEPSGQAATAFVFGGFGRAVVATQYGTLLVQPATVLVFGVAAIPVGQHGQFAMPLPATPGLRGVRFQVQDLVVLPSLGAALSNGLDVTLQ